MLKIYGPKIFMAALVFAALFLLTACTSTKDDNTEPKTISFDSKGGTNIENINIPGSGEIDLPIPQLADAQFIGWFYEETDEYFNSTDNLNTDATLYAKYEPKETVLYDEYLDDTNPVVTIEIKDYGILQIELFSDVAPNTVRNFVSLIDSGYYDDVTFHRIIELFMIQGGQGDSVDWSITGEFSDNGYTNPLSHTRGVISMARTPIYDSASTQFFIVHENSIFLDEQYAAFGGLIGGFTVLDAIATTPTNSVDAPLDTIEIVRAIVDTKGIDYDSPSRISR